MTKQLRSEIAVTERITALRSGAYDGRALTPEDGWDYYAAEDDELTLEDLRTALSESPWQND